MKLNTDREIVMLGRHETIDKLEVYDERGRPVGSVRLPADPSPVGADKGTVYLARSLPSISESVGPAQAA